MFPFFIFTLERSWRIPAAGGRIAWKGCAPCSARHAGKPFGPSAGGQRRFPAGPACRSLASRIDTGSHAAGSAKRRYWSSSGRAKAGRRQRRLPRAPGPFNGGSRGRPGAPIGPTRVRSAGPSRGTGFFALSRMGRSSLPTGCRPPGRRMIRGGGWRTWCGSPDGASKEALPPMPKDPAYDDARLETRTREAQESYGGGLPG